MFDNYDVKYVHRRLTAAGLNMLEHLRELTYAHAQAQGHEDLWPIIWKHTLPSIAYYNKYIQRSVANEVIAQIPDIEKSVQTTFQLYCKLYFGKDVHGNVNIIKGTVPPFSEFYHCFLTRLCADPAVVRLQVFDNHDLLEKAVKNAVLDALRDTSVDRVQILETLTEAQFKARSMPAAAAAVKKPSQVPEDEDLVASRVSSSRISDDRAESSQISRITAATESTAAAAEQDETEADDDERTEKMDAQKERDERGGRDARVSRFPERREDTADRPSTHFMIHSGVLPTPKSPRPAPPTAEHQSAVSVHGAEWLKRLETAAPMKKYSALGPDDSASSINSLGIQHQQRQKHASFLGQEELSSLLPTTRRINMATAIDSASMPPSSQIKKPSKSLFSDKASLF
jgi:hypothetical protein